MDATLGELALLEKTSPKRLTNPSYLHGWRFFEVLESDDDETLPIKAALFDTGPTIVINPEWISTEDLECPRAAHMSLSLIFSEISRAVLNEAMSAMDGIGRYKSARWAAFREMACRHISMEWTAVIEAAKRESLEFMAEHMAFSLLVESGIQSKLVARMTGGHTLKIA